MLRSVALAGALIVSACGGGAAAPTATATAPAASAGGGAKASVSLKSFSFRPPSLDVPVGTTVTWTNTDGTDHTTTSGAPAAKDGKWDAPLAASGGTFSFTFAQAGTFAYFCSIHGASMTGAIVVK